MSRWMRYRLQDKAGEGDGGGGAGAAAAGAGAAGGEGDKGAAAASGAAAGAAGDKGEGGAATGADKGAGAGSGADWRAAIAGDNADALKTLARFASPKALWDSYDALRARMSKGELKNVTSFPEKGTAEQQSAWRAEHDVPPEPGKYEIKLPEGIEITAGDKPMIDGFTKFAHAKNLPQAAVNDVVNWYFAEQIQNSERALENFEAQRTATAAELGREWGVEYKATQNRIQGVIDATVPADQKDLKEAINRAIATNPHFARHYAAIALQLNPAGTLVPGDHGANEATLADEIKKIETTMRTNRRAYDKDEGAQKRYRELLGAYSKMAGKEWGQ